MARPKNKPNKVTREAVARALEGGPLPSDQLLTIGRLCMGMMARMQQLAGEINVESLGKAAYTEFKEWARLAIDANNKAAPYFAYRYSAVKLEQGVPDLSGMTNDELNEVERTARLIAQHRGNPDGAASKVH
jgi:hypothetical protein